MLINNNNDHKLVCDAIKYLGEKLTCLGASQDFSIKAKLKSIEDILPAAVFNV